MKILPLYFVPPLLTQWLIRLVALFWWNIFYEFNSTGFENLEKITKGPIIFAANHVNDWDGPLIRSAMPMFSRFSPMFYVSLEKKYYKTNDRGWLRRALWGGNKFKLVGAYPVYSGVHDLNKSLKNHIKILNDNGSVCIFPEGKRTLTKEMSEFKIGVSYLAYISDCPVIPTRIKYTRKKDGTVRGVSIFFGKPLYYENGDDDSADKLQAFSNTIREKVLSLGLE